MEDSKYKGSYQADSWKSSDSDNQVDNNEKIEQLENELNKVNFQEEDVKFNIL